MAWQPFRSAVLTVAVASGLLCPSAPLEAAKPEPTPPKVEAIRRAIEDLSQRFGDRYPDGKAYLQRLREIEAMPPGAGRTEALAALRREALLANPLLDFEQILLIRRDEEGNRKGIRRKSPPIGLPQNWQCNASLGRDKWDNEIVSMIGFESGKPTLKTLYEPELDVLITDLELHGEARKALFSSLDGKRVWQIYEMDLTTREIRQVTPPDLGGDSFDACYLPNEDILFACTAIEQCVPCTGGQDPIANLFRMKPDGTGIRRLCFDQDQNWSPAVTAQGTVLYTRWQYSDQAHFFGRVLMQMNPDGTNQRDFYGSGSYWPTSLFYVRPIPNNPYRFIGIVSGHHGVPRMGELVLFDTRLGRRETVDHSGQAPGVVQRIGHRDRKVPARIEDALVDRSWPKFLHPFPLDGTTFLVSAKPDKDAPWGVYLVDVFDNMVLLHREQGKVLFEPLPVRSRPRPPVIPDRVDLESDEARVYIADIYAGPGLEGVPRGTVKQLQVYTFNFPISGGHQGRGHSLYAAGISGPWDLHALLGRVPVDEDGSASFVIPANTPFSLQPLDDEGKAVQVMRSWMTAMPGENLSCAGCHEQTGKAPMSRFSTAFVREPSRIEPVAGLTGAICFRRDIQPVLDRRCTGCHNGQGTPDKPDLRNLALERDQTFGRAYKVKAKQFSRSYYTLQRYVYRPGPESEMSILNPMEHHADASELVQMLQKGHHGVRLEADEWDRLITWIDMNAPYYGSWEEASGGSSGVARRLRTRNELMLRFANQPWDLEDLEAIKAEPIAFQPPRRQAKAPAKPANPKGWPFSADEARDMQTLDRSQTRRVLSLPGGVEMEMVWVPAGSMVMGSAQETPDEYPQAVVRIDRGFWMSVTEVSNRQYAAFDPNHNSRYFSGMWMNLTRRGLEPMNQPGQPVVRISWQEARDYCRWLNRQTGQRVDLPTEAQWEWACRAGGQTPFGQVPAEKQEDIANCAGVSFGKFHDSKTFTHRLFEASWDDGRIVTEQVDQNTPNAWGLKNMHGNAAEWTRSLYKPYPYDEADGRNDPDAKGKRVVRGGSFSDRPKRCTASYRLGYRSWQGVYNVGFRVILRPRQGESNGS